MTLSPNALRCALFAVMLPFCASCATIMNQGPEHLPVSSTPAGATIYLDGAQVGTTPSTVTLKRRGCKGLIRLELDGYHDASFQVADYFSGWTFVNVFWGLSGIVFLIVDEASGCTRHWAEAPLHCELTPADQPFDAEIVRWPIPKKASELGWDPDTSTANEDDF